MSNSAQAFPEIEVVCKDRKRNFCLNLGAFRALEENQAAERNDPDFSVLEDFDWTDTSLRSLVRVVWAGFYTDSREHDKEPWTIEKAEHVVEFLGVAQIKNCIEESLRRAMTPEQYKKMQREGEKKIQERRKRVKGKRA